MTAKEKKATRKNDEITESIVNNEVEQTEVNEVKQTEVKEVETQAEPAEEKQEVSDVSAEPVAEEATEIVTEKIPEVVTEVTPEVVTEETPQIIAQETPAFATEETAEVVAEVAPEVVAEEAPEVFAEAAPEIVAEKPKKVSKSKTAAEKESAPSAKSSGNVGFDDFDWAVINNKHDDYKPEDRKKFSDLYDETLSTVAENECIDGTVISLNKREVVINIGYKSEGVVSLNEFRYNPELKPGDVVEIYVESKEDKKGQLLLSHKKARAMRSWDRVNSALEQDEIIKGYIKCRTKGGMIVDVFGIEAFLPGSQIDVKPIRDYDAFVGKTMEFKVVKINHEFKNVVVSHKALIEAELEQQKKEIIAKLEKGQVLEGTVKNITSYGVFIDLGGVDGLIHITDLSWGRVNHPEEIVQLDQKLNVVILDFDDDKKRIALGLKQLTSHPWDSLSETLKVGDQIKGKVVVMADYGAFVEITTGVEGLIHVSEMSWSQHLRSAQEFMKVGDEVEAIVLTLDREERKMSLGIKQLKTDPWDKISEKYAVGSKHTAKVRNFTNFGVFVEIEEGVDGLIHISDLSWTRKIKHPAEFTSIGADIEVVVLEIDKDNRRLSLGHKQLEENPWDVFETLFMVDSVHEGTIVEMTDKGAIVALSYGVEGFVSQKHLVKENGQQAKVEEKLPFKVMEFSKGSKKIVLSHTRVFEDDKKNAEETKEKTQQVTTKKVQRNLTANLEKTTLGDISELAALKDKMEKSQKKKKADAKDKENT